jgi:predicted DsbA family dithiol-disulfide isomerase
MEPHIMKIRKQLGESVTWRNVMAGLLPRWDFFHDSVNVISRPLQVGPLWMHIENLTGRNVAHKIWKVDPPWSSYPSCIAVKCASLQSTDAEETYLHEVRDACLVKGLNISRTNVLFNIAEQMSKNNSDFNFEIFVEDYRSGRGKDSFQKEINEVRLRGIARLPSLLVRYADQQPLMATGYKDYPALLACFKELHSSLEQEFGLELTN